MTKAIVVRVEGDYVITAQGADLLATLSGQATAARDEAVTAAASAAAAAGVGEYPDTGAGLSGTTEGETFWVDLGDGTGRVYRHDPGPTATPLQKFIIDPTDSGAADIFAGGVPTTAALASPTGADMMGVSGGGTVQGALDERARVLRPTHLPNEPFASQITRETASRSWVFFPLVNGIATDLRSSVVSGGGTATAPNLIGYLDLTDIVAGDGTETVFVTTFGVLSTANVVVNLLRADNVRVNVTMNCGLAIVGGKVQVTYPQPGHFVNDGPSGAEGSNPAVLSTQKLIISAREAQENEGSLSDYSGIYGGYNNVIQQGVMQHIVGAHHRITGGDHNSIYGGSYHRITGGSFGGIFGGTGHVIEVTDGRGSVIVGGANSGITGTLGPVFLLASNSVAAGAGTSVFGSGHSAGGSGNGKFVAGRNNVYSSGNGGFLAGEENSLSGAYALCAGFQVAVSATGAGALGRGNTASQSYSFATGYGAITRGRFSHVIGCQPFAANGDAQHGRYGAKVATTDDTPTAATVLTMGQNTTIAIDALVVGREVGGASSGGFRISTVMVRNGSGAPAHLGTPSVTPLDGTPGGWVAALAPTASGIEVRVTGEAAKDIRWVASLTTAEVGG